MGSGLLVLNVRANLLKWRQWLLPWWRPEAEPDATRPSLQSVVRHCEDGAAVCAWISVCAQASDVRKEVAADAALVCSAPRWGLC